MSTREPRIELARRAVRDLRRIDGPVRRRIHQALVDLADGAENADVTALTGAAPWLRLRVGDWRVLYRPLTGEEATALAEADIDEAGEKVAEPPVREDADEIEEADGIPGLLVARVVNRRDLLRAVHTLDT